MATSTNLPGIVHDLKGLTCGICFAVFSFPKLLDCGHTFCLACLKKVVKKKTSSIDCPFCRSNTKVRGGNVENLTQNIALMSLVHEVLYLEDSCGRCEQIFKRQSLFYCYRCGVSMCVKCKVIHFIYCVVQSKVDHTTSQNVPTLSNLITQCQIHVGESNTKVCLSCDKQLCNKCEENHPKESHELKSNDTFVNELRAKASSLQQESQFLVNECKKSHQIVVQNGQKANVLLAELIREIHNEHETVTVKLNKRRLFLLQSVEVLKNKIAKLEKDMADCGIESTDLLMNINASTDQMLRFPLKQMLLHTTCLNENTRKVNAMRNSKDDKTNLSSEIVDSIQKMHFERSFGENDILIGSLSMHNWNRTDIPLKSNTMSCATQRGDGTLTVGYLDGGVSWISASGSSRTVLRDVKVLAIACYKRGDLVLRDIDNDISIYDTRLKKSKAKFVTLGKEEGGEGDMTVDTRDDIFVSYKRVKQIHVYSQRGGKAIRIIQCDLIPQQISATVSSGVLVMDASQVLLINDHGKHISELKRDGYFGYPSVSSHGSLCIAWVHEQGNNVRFVQYTNQLKPSTLVLTDYSLPLMGRNWYQLQLLSSDEIALISPDTIHLYRRRKTTFGDESLGYIARNIGTKLEKVLV